MEILFVNMHMSFLVVKEKVIETRYQIEGSYIHMIQGKRSL